MIRSEHAASTPARRSALTEGVPNRRAVLLMAGILGTAGAGIATWAMWPVAGAGSGEASIHVVTGAAPAPAPATGVLPSPPMPAGTRPLRDMPLIERQLLVRASASDPARAAVITRALAAQRLAIAGRPVTIDEVIVRDGVCEIQGSVAINAGDRQQSLVDGLTGPIIQDAVARVGLTGATAISVNKKGDDMLTFTLHANAGS